MRGADGIESRDAVLLGSGGMASTSLMAQIKEERREGFESDEA